MKTRRTKMARMAPLPPMAMAAGEAMTAAPLEATVGTRLKLLLVTGRHDSMIGLSILKSLSLATSVLAFKASSFAG